MNPADHLWQSTAVAVAAGLLVRMVGSGHAGLRHALWLAASMKFLVPFAALAALGARLTPASAGLPASTMRSGLRAISEPFSVIATPSNGVAIPDAALGVLTVIWFTGAVVVLAVRLTEWRRISQDAANGSSAHSSRETRAVAGVLARAGRSRALPVRESAVAREPCLFGVVRPALFWPAGLLAHLDADELRAVIAHELCHLRRRDNATAVLHMAVEVLFWFHPLVWWIGARLLEERERACDQQVLRQGTPPSVYAGALLKVCRFGLSPAGPFAAAAAQSDLRHRVEVIMSSGVPVTLGLGKALVVSVAVALLVGGPIVLGATDGARHAVPRAVPADLTLPGGRPDQALAGRIRPAAVSARQADPIAEFRRGAMSPDTEGLDKPRPVKTTTPLYTAEAMRAKVAGAVELEIVVTSDGQVARARVVKGLDPGLDQTAMTAVRSWVFAPGRFNGEPVAVWCAVTLTFRLH